MYEMYFISVFYRIIIKTYVRTDNGAVFVIDRFNNLYNKSYTCTLMGKHAIPSPYETKKKASADS